MFMSKNNTKRSLLASVFALVLCVAMLVGSTFAWFTDTASTGVNKIQAGNLDIKVEYAKEKMNDDGTLTGELTDWAPIDNATNVFDPNALWEPGRTEYVVFRITNNGNLALKYKLSLETLAQKPGTNKANEQFYLADYLCASAKVNVGPGEIGSGVSTLGAFMTKLNDLSVAGVQNVLDPEYHPLTDATVNGTLLPGKTNCVPMAIWMPTSVGNEANAISPDKAATIDFGINVVATQDTVEKDSFGPDYDADAEYPAITAGATLDDVFTGLTDKDGNGVDFGVNAPAKDVSVNGQGIATVTGFADAWVAGDVTIKGVKFLNGACFTAKENGTTGTLTLEDCTFYACDQSKIDLAPYAHNSLKNSGDGLCLNVDTKDSPNLKVVIKNCRFIGENDPTLNRDGWKDIGGTNWDPDTAVKNKSRGHAVMINGICGGGNNATAESVLIEGCTMDGIRGHAIQLYQLRMGVTVKDCTINSWGNNAQTTAGTKSDAAIRGDIAGGSGSLTVTNTYFGLNESSSLRHINVDNYSGNTNGSRVAGTY